MRMKRLCAVCLVAVLLAALPCLQAGAGAAEPPAWPGVEVVQLKKGQKYALAPGSEFVIRAGRVGLDAHVVYDLTAGLSFAGNLPECRAVDAFHRAWLAVRGDAELVDEATRKVIKRVEGASLWEFEQERPNKSGMRVRVWRPFPEVLKVYPVPENPYSRWGGYNGQVEELGVLYSPVWLLPGKGALAWSSLCGGPDEGVEFAIAPREERERGLEVNMFAAHLPTGHFFVTRPDSGWVYLVAVTDAFVVVRRATQDEWGKWRKVTLKEGDELRIGQGSLLTLIGGRARTKDTSYYCLNLRYRAWGPPWGPLREVDLRVGSLLFATKDVRVTPCPGGAELLVRGPCTVNAELPSATCGWQWQRVVVPAGSGQAVLLGPGSEAVVPIPWWAKAQAGPGGGLADLGEGRDLRQDECVARPTLVMAPRGDGRGLVVNQPLFEAWVRGPYSLIGGDAK